MILKSAPLRVAMVPCSRVEIPLHSTVHLLVADDALVLPQFTRPVHDRERRAASTSGRPSTSRPSPTVLEIIALVLFLAAGNVVALAAARLVQGIATGAATTNLGATLGREAVLVPADDDAHETRIRGGDDRPAALRWPLS